ncbi:VOC family protein [Streptomyces celluloflavus]|uniref:VOC family protein n=1 Tax=Streptomyces celluloflavus TaxID=58344 RepID=A0ABW7RRH2_9ACTN|nr:MULTISPECIES: VOC family protein [Streptomyces]MYU56659.1 catechol 2,3-dioxygenase [Streptomyces sp. SID7805]WSK10403.1 VOC family protein [Streptomyces celluloflavus]WSK17163.1 VOC family protein [Streptomyces celluloflavus]
MTEERYRHEIAHLARVELHTPNPDGTLWFFKDLLGMYETKREGQSVYLRGYEDPYQWSLKVTEGPEARMDHAALRTSSPEALERRIASLREGNLDGAWSDGEFGYGKTYEFDTPDGHKMALLWEVEKYQAPPQLQSKILSRASKKPLQGLPVKRIDHLNLLAREVTPVKESFERHLGMKTHERVVDGDIETGAWMSSSLLSHDVAVMRDARGARGRLHHVAFYYGVQQHTIDAAEMFRDYGIPIEAGPDRHGITQSSFLYVFEPGGNRIELFGDPGFLVLEPDFETRTWTMDQIDTGTAIGGTNLPAETYFTYGTPPIEPIPDIVRR